jgi:hypothetical protein
MFFLGRIFKSRQEGQFELKSNDEYVYKPIIEMQKINSYGFNEI